MADVPISKRPDARALSLCLLLVIGGCAGLSEAPPEAPEAELEEIEPEVRPRPEPEAAPDPVPEPVAPPAPLPEPEAPRVAVVLSERSQAYERVAEELAPLLERPLVYNLSDKSLSATAAFLAIADSAVDVVIAIGLHAAEAASELSSVPVVYCQVFNFVAPDEPTIPIKGVSSIPPLSLQLSAWKQITPGLGKVGTIVGSGHGALVEEARAAGTEHGVGVEHRVVSSDRETLYLFKRMAPAIDGFWLFPDNRVLSIAVLREILQSASRYDVEVAVFNAGLLELGAALSSVAVYRDVAATAFSVAQRLAAGESDSVPDVTALSEVEIRTAFGAGATPAGARP